MTDIQAAGLWAFWCAVVSIVCIVLLTVFIWLGINKTFIPFDGIPHCGNCGYQVEPGKDPSVRCPECGSLRDRNGRLVFLSPGKKPNWFSTRMGQRRLRAGAFFALACSLGAGVLLHAWDINTYSRYIPSFWLATVEYDLANAKRRATVVSIVSGRWRLQNLSHRARQALADRTIERVLQPGHVFNENEYTILLRGWNEDLLTDEEFSEFLHSNLIMDFYQSGSGRKADWYSEISLPRTPGLKLITDLYAKRKGQAHDGMLSFHYEQIFIDGEEFLIKPDNFWGSVLGIYFRKYCARLEMKNRKRFKVIEQHALEDGEVVAKVIGAIGLTLRDSKGDKLGGSKKPHLKMPFEFTTTVNLKDLQAQVQANGLTQFKKVATP